MIPERQHLFEGVIHFVSIAKSGVYCARFFDRFSLAEQKDHFARFTRLQIDRCLNRGARIQTGAVATGKSRAL